MKILSSDTNLLMYSLRVFTKDTVDKKSNSDYCKLTLTFWITIKTGPNR